jgi:hypothetical protein
MSAFRKAVTACAVAGAGLMLAVVPASAALVAAPAQAATAASPATTAATASGTACTTTIRWYGWWETCFRIDGQGLHIENAKAWTTNNSFYNIPAHFEIIGPSGHILNCADFHASPGRSPDCRWDPHADVPAGRYCTKLWAWDGHWFQVGINTCIDVRP